MSGQVTNYPRLMNIFYVVDKQPIGQDTEMLGQESEGQAGDQDGKSNSLPLPNAGHVYVVGTPRAGVKLVCWMGRGISEGLQAMPGAARNNPVKTVAIMALLALLGMVIAKSMGHGAPFDLIKKLVLEHKLDSSIVAGSMGLGLLGYGYGRYQQDPAEFLKELKGLIPKFKEDDQEEVQQNEVPDSL